MVEHGKYVIKIDCKTTGRSLVFENRYNSVNKQGRNHKLLCWFNVADSNKWQEFRDKHFIDLGKKGTHSYIHTHCVYISYCILSLYITSVSIYLVIFASQTFVWRSTSLPLFRNYWVIFVRFLLWQWWNFSYCFSFGTDQFQSKLYDAVIHVQNCEASDYVVNVW